VLSECVDRIFELLLIFVG